MPAESKIEGRFWCIRDEDDEEIRARLPQHYSTAFILWAHLERLSYRQGTSKVVVRQGLLVHVTGLSKRCVQTRVQDLARIGFLQVTSRRNTEGNLYELLRGIKAKVGCTGQPVAPESATATVSRNGSCLLMLRGTGKFPNLTDEALALAERGYTGLLKKHVCDISERARVCATGTIGDPVAWLRTRLSEFAVNHDREQKELTRKEREYAESLSRFGPSGENM